MPPASNLTRERRLLKKKGASKGKRPDSSLRKKGEKGSAGKKSKANPMKRVLEKVADKEMEEKEKTEKLDPKTLSRLKKLLLKEREQIVGEVKQTYASSQEMGQDGIQDIGDEAANIYNKQILLSLNENERMRLQEVDEALDRMASGTYGICEECGEPISLKRLEIRPWAKYCVACLSKMEKGLI